jgi:glycogen synthase
VSRTVDAAGMIDALHRATRAVRQPNRRKALQRRGMTVDWSWTQPAIDHLAVYRELFTR